MAHYELRIYDATNTLIAISTSFQELSYTNAVNAIGVLECRYLAGDPVVDELAIDGRIDVVRYDETLGIARSVDWTGLIRCLEWHHEQADTVTFRAFTWLDLLARRIVAWHAGTSNRSEFNNVPAETIAKTLVSYNAGSSATTANGRLVNGVINGLTVQSDNGSGNQLTIGCAYQNLLETLQKISDIGGGDFDLVRSGSNLEFRWYAGQRGTDRRATVLFALERGNMGEPAAILDCSQERSVVIVGGQGEESNRTVVVRTASGLSTIVAEAFVAGQNLDTTDGLNALGDQQLAEMRAKRTFTFKVLQTPGCLYGLHYQLGDLVRAVWRGTAYDVKIESIQISLTEQGEDVQVGVRAL